MIETMRWDDPLCLKIDQLVFSNEENLNRVRVNIVNTEGAFLRRAELNLVRSRLESPLLKRATIGPWRKFDLVSLPNDEAHRG